MVRWGSFLNNNVIYRRVMAFAARHPALATAAAASPIAPMGDLLCQTLEISWERHSCSSADSSSPAMSSLSCSGPSWSAEFGTLPFAEKASKPRKTHIDWQRFGAAAVFGACVSAPIGVWWFPWVDRVVKRRLPNILEGSFSFVMLKTVAEGVLIGPPFTIAYFVIVSAIQGGEKWATLIPRMKMDIVATNIADQAWWLLVAPLNYKFIPVASQVFFANIATAIEMMAFSWIQHNRTCQPCQAHIEVSA